jgi:triacylglycerol lipase
MRRRPWILPAFLAFSASLTAAPTATAAPHDPVIFVHGWKGGSWIWGVMVSDFEADGYTEDELRTVDYTSSQSNVATAEEIAEVVDETLAATGAEKVDIVSHSMGALNTRYYLKNLDGTGKVDDWVSLGGPNHGTETANVCGDASCEQMRPGSDFLNDLNASDETPAGPDYATWWSPCDEIINPDESVVLDGATNTKTGCVGHVSMLADETISQQVRDFVA